MTTNTREDAVLAAVQTRLFIGGHWRDAAGGGRFPVRDPATGEVLAEVADAQAGDALAALGAAHDAQESFAGTTARERGEVLRGAYELMMERIGDLALLMTLEMGKSVAESRTEVAYAADFLHWFAGEAARIGGDYRVAEKSNEQRVLVMRQPVGPSILITPWNFPLAMGTRKIGPAIAAGCTMVAKPAKDTPLSMLMLAQILQEAGLPGGALNVITASSSSSVMEPVIKDRRARKLSFTGSTEVGRVLMAQASEQILRVSMELGGNAPFLVFEDADLDAAVDGAMVAKMRNIGEACTAANRFHVHESIADDFARRLAERMGALRVGRGTEDGIDVGPLINEEQLAKVERLVADAVAKGAKLLVGGDRVGDRGSFYAPTVLADVSGDAELLRTEIFGPVAPVRSFATEDEAVEAANATEFGLVAYVYTTNLERALRVCERLQTGMVGLNQGMVSNAGAPFGGVKHSGVGREGGDEGIREFLETKYVAVAASSR